MNANKRMCLNNSIGSLWDVEKQFDTNNGPYSMTSGKAGGMGCEPLKAVFKNHYFMHPAGPSMIIIIVYNIGSLLERSNFGRLPRKVGGLSMILRLTKVLIVFKGSNIHERKREAELTASSGS
jgi:hypothetical protein